MRRLNAALLLASLPALGHAQSATSDAFRRAVQDMQAGRFAAAQPVLEKLVQQYPNHLEARNNLAVCLIKARHFADAEKHLQFILQADPSKAGAHQNLGVADHSLAKSPEALKETETAAGLFDSQQAPAEHRAKALFNKGWLLDEQGKSTEAVQAYQQAVALKPDYARAWVGLAVAFAKSDRANDALLAVNKANETKGNDAEIGGLANAVTSAMLGRYLKYGFIRRVGWWDSHPVLSILGYLVVHVLAFLIAANVITAKYSTPLDPGENVVMSLVCFLLSSLIFFLGWGWEPWTILLGLSALTAIVGLVLGR